MLISYHVTITITLSPLEQKQDHPISSDSYVDQQALSVLQADLKISKSGFMAIKVIILHNVQWMTVTEPMFSFHILCFLGEEMCTDWMKKKLESTNQPKKKPSAETAEDEAAR